MPDNTVAQLASGSFGTYINDGDFINDIGPTIIYVRRNLGYPVLQVELDDFQVASAFEEATFEYSAMVGSYNMRNILSSILGDTTGSTGPDFQGKLPRRNMEFAKRLSAFWGMEADKSVGGDYNIKTGYFTTSIHTQSYDLALYGIDQDTGNTVTSIHGSGSFEIKEIFHYEPTYMSLQYQGVTSPYFGLSYAYGNDYGTYAGGGGDFYQTIFFMYPVWEQIQKAQHVDTYRRARRSNYSAYVQNRTAVIHPIPNQNFRIYFKYRRIPISSLDADWNDTSIFGVSDISNARFTNITYTNINSIGRQWIRKYTLSICKEVLGIIRSKFASLPIPNGEVSLNGEALKAEGREEMQLLKEQLKELLESTQYRVLMQSDAEMHNAITEQFAKAPLGIYLM